MKLKTLKGQEVTILDTVNIQGKEYFLVDMGSKYINGVLTKYIVCPQNQFERIIPDKVNNES